MDAYVFDPSVGRYRFVVPANNLFGTRTLTAVLTPEGVNVTALGSPLRWLLNTPTYNELQELYIGTAQGASIVPDTPYSPAGRAPIVWYGTR